MIFCKYEFEPSVWESLKPTIQQEVRENVYGFKDCMVVEIGHLCTKYGPDEMGRNVCVETSPKCSVDILWYSDIPEDFNQYEVFPEPTGIHTFDGLDYLYKQRFCQFNPNSPHCDVN